MRYCYILIALTCCGVAVCQSPVESQAWTQWRGPQRSGQIPAGALPDAMKLDALSAVWSVPMGPSYSGPLVDADRVYVTESKDQEDEAVVALDRQTGKEIWRTQWPGSMTVPFFAASNGSWIRSTPALADGKLFVAGMRDVLVCLRAADGQKIWSIDFPEQLQSPMPSFGFVASPLVDAGFVYVQAGGGLTKVEADTGKIVWQSLKDGGGMSGGAFSSPVMVSIHGKKQLIVQTRTRLAGVDEARGDELWGVDVPAFRGMNILTPTVIGDAVFTSSYGGGSFLFDIIATNGKLITQDRWQNKREGYMSSPVVIDDHIYLHMKNQRFTCIGIADGEERWATKPFGKYWSMIASGNQILALDERGDLMVIRATPEKFDLVETRHISDTSTWAHLGVSGNQVFVRALDAQMTFAWN